MSASIVYTLIARSTKTVLCDYTEFTGNFQQISLLILGRIKKDSNVKLSIMIINIIMMMKMILHFYVCVKTLKLKLLFNIYQN